MNQVYNTQFSVEATEEGTFESVRSDIIEWVEERVASWTGRFTKFQADSVFDHEIGIELKNENIDNDMWQLIYRVPHRNDSTSVWETKISLRRDLSSVIVDVSVCTNHVYVSPTRPKVIPKIVDKYNCYKGEYVLRSKPIVVSRNDVGKFIEDLKYNNRTIPYVVITRHNEDGFLVSAERLANLLAGTANVYVLDDNASTYTLSASLPKYWSVYNGAVRVYLPTLGTDMFRHRLYTSDYIRQCGDKIVEQRIFRYITQHLDDKLINENIQDEKLELKPIEVNHVR